MPDDHAGPDTPLAIIAGRGRLPRDIAERRADCGDPYVLIIFPDCEEPWMAAHPHEHHRFERLGRVFRALKARHVTHIVFAGAMNRPRIRPWLMDFSTIRLAMRALPLLRQGDDAMLRGYARLVEDQGFTMIGPAEILGETLTVPAGAMTARTPTKRDRTDSDRAAAIVAALGPLDVGQGAVVANGICLAVEAIEGTDLMLSRVAQLPSDRRGATPSGVLYKGPKPDQDRRLDMPTIGPDTVVRAAEAGLKGIIVKAGETVLLDPSGTRAAAEKAGLFVFGIDETEPRE